MLTKRTQHRGKVVMILLELFQLLV